MTLKDLNFKKLIILIMACAGFIMFSACEDIIQLDLKNVEPRLVIEASIIDRPNLATVIISETVGFYDRNRFPMISNAIVVISDDAGNVDTLAEYEQGVYMSPYIEVAVGRTYTATVNVDGMTYTATATMPESIEIDSLTTEYQEGGGIGQEEDEGYRLHLYFSDDENVDNYARIMIKTSFYGFILDYYLYDDKYSNGNHINYGDFFTVFILGDTIVTDLYAMDETVYDYFRTLINAVGSGDNDDNNAVPANPNTNWDNDVLGYFGAFALRSDTIIVSDQ